MSFIVRDPSLHNMPKGYAAFRDLTSSGRSAQSIGFRKDIGHVSRFASRFRVAKSFDGIQLQGYTVPTVRGYNALFKVFLAYTAYDLFKGIAPEALIAERAKDYPVKALMTEIRKRDRSIQWIKFLKDHATVKWRNKLGDIMSGQSDDIFDLAAAARHIFAHGHLTAHPGGVDASEPVIICDILFDFLMKFMDNEFDRIITEFKNETKEASARSGG